jgi:hypothetical protein
MTTKTVDEIRRANLRALVNEAGGQAKLARVVGISEAQMTQWINGSPDSRTGKARGMRPESCRRVEEAAGKPPGWMDAAHELRVVGAKGDPIGIENAFEIVGVALANAPRGMREAIAQNMAGWAREGGAGHYRVALLAMLSLDSCDLKA